MAVVKSSPKGQVVIPAHLREKIGLRPGSMVLLTPAGGRRVVIEPVPDDPIEAACGMLQGGPPLTEALIEERRRDNARGATLGSRFLRATGLPQQRTGVRKGAAAPARRRRRAPLDE